MRAGRGESGGEAGYRGGASPGRPGKLARKHNALARRLLDRQDDHLRFTRGWQVPPDNNGAERDIRMIKQFCAIRSYLSTAAKHGVCFIDALVMLAKGQPWMPATA